MSDEKKLEKALSRKERKIARKSRNEAISKLSTFFKWITGRL